nr:hypothetical protein [Tanacetum cinerariifolium]
MGRDTVQLETAVNTFSQEYLLEFTSEYGIPEALHPELPRPEDRIVDFPEGKDPTAATDSTGVPSTIERSPLDFATEAGAEDPGTMAPEVPPPEDVPTTRGVPEAGQAERVAAADPPAVGESRKRGHDGVDANAPRSSPADVSDPDPLSFADPQSRHPADIAQSSQGTAAAGDSESKNTSFASVLRLRFEQEAKLLKKSVAQVARRDKRIKAREHEIKNLEALLEAEADMKKAAEDKSAKLSQELENIRTLFSDLQVSNDHLSQQVATLQKQVNGEEKLKAAFEEFKHESLEMRQAFIDIVSARIAKDMSEGLRHGVEHGRAQLDLKALEAYHPEAEAKYIAALQVLKNLKYPLVDQLEGLKDAPMDVIMAALYLESDTGDDVSQWVRELRPSSSKLTIPMYPKVRDPLNPWACKEEMLLADAIAANVSRAEKKKKCRVVCRTHRVGSAHHARSDGVPVSVSTVIPQGLAILLADAATQMESDEAFQLPRSSSLPNMHS